MSVNTELFDRIIAETMAANAGATTREIADAALAAGVFDAEWHANVALTRANEEARKRIKTAKDKNGMPLYWNVGQGNEDDEDETKENVYKPLPLFELKDYEAAARPYLKMVERGAEVLRYLRAAAQNDGVQLALPFWLPEPVAA